MSKYTLKENEKAKFDIVKAKKDTEVETVFGTILVTKDNYIATDDNGNKFGVTEADLNVLYTPVKK